MNKIEFTKMLASLGIDFIVKGNLIIIPYGDTNTETVFQFTRDGECCDTWSRQQLN